MLDVIKSYLVALGFQVNQPEFDKAQNAVTGLGRTIQTATAGMTRNFAAAATGVTAALAAINAATAGLMTQVADADMQYQKFALRLWTTKENAKELKTVLDAMGESMEDVAWIPELRQQYFQLVSQGRQMQTPGDAGGQLRYVRSILFEFKRMKLEVQYATEWIAYYLGKYLSGPLANIKKQLGDFNERLTATMPHWTKRIAEVLVTIMNVGMAVVRFIRDLYRGVMRLFDMLPVGVKKAAMAIAAIGLAFRISPLGAVITAFLILLEDFYGYIDGRKSSKTLAPIWRKLIEWFEKIKELLPVVKGHLEDFWAEIKKSDGYALSVKILHDVFRFLEATLRNIPPLLVEAFSEIGKSLVKNGVLESFRNMFYEIGKAIDMIFVGLSKVMEKLGLLSSSSKYKSFWSWFGDELSRELKNLATFGSILAKLVQLIVTVMSGDVKSAAAIGRSIVGDIGSIFGLSGENSAGGGGGGGSFTERLRKAIADKESGGNPTAANYDGMAFGKYQFQQGTWDSVARMAGRDDLVGIDPRDVSEADQDQVAQFYVNYLWSKYHDAKKVAAVWYAGETYVDQWAAGNPPYDPNAPMDREGYVITSPRSSGEAAYPSVNSYGQDIVNRMGSASPMSYTGFDTAGIVTNARDNMAFYRQNAYAPYAQALDGGGGSSMSVGPVYISITQPNATPDQIQQAVTEGMRQAQQKNTAIQIRELKPVIL